jgi:excisionase family DNA binding protein
VTSTVFAERGHALSHEPLAYRVNDFCSAVGIGRSLAYRMIKNGDLPRVKVGNRRLIPRHAAVKLIENGLVSVGRK